MAKDTFSEKYPGYDIIPEKKSRWQGPLTWIAALALLIGVPYYMFSKLAYDVPTPALAGNNKFTLPTLAALAVEKARANQYGEAASTLERYFALGGQEAEMMALYAQSLAALGRRDEARDWSDKAIAKDPESKAARFIRDSLER